MRGPNFFCIGAPKCGTTTLYEILVEHPDIYVPSFKEPGFFNISDNYKKGYDWYLNEYFSNVTDEIVIGEFTPSYMFMPDVPKRILQILGKDLKIILILRNPVERAYSQFLHLRRNMQEILSFEDALLAENERLGLSIKNGDDIGYIRYSYIESGLYAKHIRRWLEYFERKNIKIIIFEEEFINNRKYLIDEICTFLQIDTKEVDVNKKANVAAVTKFKFIKKLIQNDFCRKIAKTVIRSQKIRNLVRNNLHKISDKPVIKIPLRQDFKKQILKKYFVEDIKELELIINRDLSIWLDDL